ncbi:hypothetical protein ACFQ0M_23325 [Kitasatospora aburaviensis]
MASGVAVAVAVAVGVTEVAAEEVVRGAVRAGRRDRGGRAFDPRVRGGGAAP